jgi:dihydroorotate dehydrogenase (fumarate)
MDLATDYMGLRLPHPFVVGASPFADTVEGAKRAEDAGAAAIVMRSLFEEELREDALATHRARSMHEESFAEALSYSPEPPAGALGPDEHLERVRGITESVSIPVIASLNGATPGGWTGYASALEAAGADALELNLFDVPTDPAVSSAELEERAIEIVRMVRAATDLPIAVKLSPFYTSLAHFAWRLGEAGAGGLVLFNRFYETVIDIEALELGLFAELSSPSELRLRLRWLGILSARWHGSLAVTGGVHTAQDALAALMAGAGSVQMVSSLIQRGLGHLGLVRREVGEWMEGKGYRSLVELRGCMNLERCPDPSAYRRGNYVRMLRTLQPEP